MKAIAAVSKNLIIGDEGVIPWKSSEDLKFFKEKTTGNNLLMGRKTFEGCPPLKDRITYVLTRGGKNYHTNSTLAFPIFDISEIPSAANLFLCGGAELYKSFLPICEELFLTIFDFEAKGDTKFPYSLKEARSIFKRVELIKSIKDGSIYKFSK